MAYTLQQLSDFEDIRNLKHRYFRAVDTCDVPLLRQLFTDDVSVDYKGGDYRAQFTGLENMIEFLVNSFHSDTIAMHQGHTPEIALIGDNTATGIWYLEDINIYAEARSQTVGTGFYSDEYRREDRRWKIARTEIDRVFSVSFPYAGRIGVNAHLLAKVGLRPEERRDITHLVAAIPSE